MPQGKGTYGKKVGRPRKQASEREGGIDKEISNLMKESDRQENKKKRDKMIKKLKKGKEYKFMYRRQVLKGKFLGLVGDKATMERTDNGKVIELKPEMISV